MAVRDDFAAGEVLAAADLNDTFASKLPYSYGTATPSTTDSGFLWYDSNSTPAAPKFWDGAAFQALTSGKILQVVNTTKTDTSAISTSSYAFTSDVLTVSITPLFSNSKIFISGHIHGSTSAELPTVQMRLTRGGSAIGVGDAASNRGLVTSTMYANDVYSANMANVAFTYLDSPATTSLTTYSVQLYNSSSITRTLYVNRSSADTDSAAQVRTISGITVMEVAA